MVVRFNNKKKMTFPCFSLKRKKKETAPKERSEFKFPITMLCSIQTLANLS